ncbi:G-protein coupled receptor [Biomphalaria glabrata]|nr:putative G-protein coupled receptor [Biomphalaria glabrata]
MNNATQLVDTSVKAVSPPPCVAQFVVCQGIVHLDSALHYTIFYILLCYVRPAMCFLGFIANSMSLAILQRNGLYKQSNILLFGLVIADSAYLVSGMNFAMIISYFGPNKLYPTLCGYQYEEVLDYFLQISNILINIIGTWGHFASTTIPVLITLERILALFKPINFKALVTANKTTALVICSFVVWLPWIFLTFSSTVIYKVKLTPTVTYMLALAQKSDLISHVSVIDKYFIRNVVSFTTLAFITFGCGAIWVKMKLTLKQRRKIASSRNNSSWSPRTTRTLVLTCFIFVLVHGMASLTANLSLFYAGRCAYSLHFFLNEGGLFIYPINASSSLFIYVLSNKKLYQDLKMILRI